MQDNAPSHRAKATQNFLRDNTPDFISSQEWTPHSPDLNPLDTLEYLARTCLRKKAWTICESQRSSECYERQMARCQTVRKAILQWKKAFNSCRKEEWRTSSAYFLLISWLIRITVTFWCSLRTTNNLNDELLANIVLLSAILFRLYHGQYGSVLGENLS